MSYILFFLYILIITIYSQNAAVVLELQMKKVSQHRSLLVTNIRVGSPSQIINVVIDINSNKTLIRLFEPKASTSNSVVEYLQYNFRQLIDNYEVKGLHLKDKTEIGSIFMQHFGFIYLFSVDSFSADLTGTNGILGLNMNNDDNKPNELKGDNWDSFIDYGNQMMFKERIVKLNLTTNDHYTISIGPFDENEAPLICENNSQDNQYYFNCFLNGLILGDLSNKVKKEVNSIKVNTFAYFSTINQIIFCPENDFNFIIGEFFEEKIQNKDCYIKELANQFNKDITKIIMCDYYTIKKMKKIHFIFSDKLIVSIEGDKLFIPEINGDYVFGIANKKSNNNWVFGYILFQFIPVAFNHEDKKVYFYQENNNILGLLDSKFDFPNNTPLSQKKINLFDFSFLQMISLLLFIITGIGCFVLYNIYIIIKNHN